MWAIANAPFYSLQGYRIRVAVVFRFLSGIRIGVFVTLPINAITLSERTIKLWPRL